MSEPISTNERLVAASSVSLGVIVVILYIVFVFIVFAGFGSYIYRGEWVDNLKNDAAVQTASSAQVQQVSDLDNLIFIVKRKKELNADLVANRSMVGQLEKEHSLLQAGYTTDLSFLNRRAAQVLSDARQDVKTLTLILGKAHGDYLVQLNEIGELDAEAHVKIARAQTAVRGVTPPLLVDEMTRSRFEAAMDSVRARHAQVQDTVNQTHARAVQQGLERTRIQAVIDQYRADDAATREELDKLEQMVPLGSPHNARHEALYFDFPIPYVGTVFQRLVSFPTIFLTLIVTMAAGALGTVVSFSRRYYHHDATDLTMSRLFVNVGEGIAAAIAIFLFSGAGMLALTQGSGAQGTVELSPYTVAFVAFLSGFMAEDAFASIQAAGKRLFANGAAKVGPDAPATPPEGAPKP